MAASVLQHKWAGDFTGTAFPSTAVTLTSAVTAGSCLHTGGTYGSGNAVPTVADNINSGNYVGGTNVFDSTDSQMEYGFIHKYNSVASSGAGSCTITATWVGNTAFVSVEAVEVGGVLTSSDPLDSNSLGTANPTGVSSVTVTSTGNLTVANELVITHLGNGSSWNPSSPPSGYTALDMNAGADFAAYQVLSGGSGSTVSATWTNGGTNGNPIVVIGAYMPLTGGAAAATPGPVVVSQQAVERAAFI